MTIMDPNPIVDVALRRHDLVLLKLAADEPWGVELFRRMGAFMRPGNTEDWKPT